MKRSTSKLSRSGGFSLVELMVALTIGLIILGAVSSLFVSSKQTYTTQDSLARLQENARFAMQFLIKDLRLAGYFGCISDIAPDSVYSSLNSSTAFAYNAQVPLEGLYGTTWYPSGTTTLPSGIVSGTDAIAIRKADPSNSISLNAEMPNTSAVLKVNSIAGLSDGDIIMISDCASADIMQITGLNSTDPHIVHNAGAGTPGNSGQQLSKAYSPSTGPGGTRVMQFKTSQYFIGTGVSGNPALFRQDNTAAPVELVEGIENLQILYGEYTTLPPDPNRQNWVPSIYREASAVSDWTKVVSVRIGILARTLDDAVTGQSKEFEKDTGQYDVDGDGTNELSNPGDRYKRRVFQSVVQMRNIL